MGQRLELHAKLKAVTGLDNVYFSPPSNLVMKYPCVVYRRDNADTKFASNSPYRVKFRYEITVITRDPDSDLVTKVLTLPGCKHDRFFTTSQLNHDTFTLYF